MASQSQLLTELDKARTTAKTGRERAKKAAETIVVKASVLGGGAAAGGIDGKFPDKKSARKVAFTDVKELGGRQAPSTMTVTVRSKPGEYTRIVYKTLKLNIDIPASKFTEQALRR